MEFYFFNWVQVSYDFGKVVPSGTTQGKVCRMSLSTNVVARMSIAIKQQLLEQKERGVVGNQIEPQVQHRQQV
jgi:hypothetical protein